MKSKATRIHWTKEGNIISNPVATLHNFIKALDLPVTLTTVRDKVTNKRQVPITELTNALSSWHVENIVVRFEKTQTEFKKTEFPAIALTKSSLNGIKLSKYVLVLEMDKNNVITLVDSLKGVVRMSYDDFSKIWTGVLLMAATNPVSGEYNYKENRLNENLIKIRRGLNTSIIFLLFSVYIWLSIQAQDFPSWISILTFVFKIIGLGFSLLIFLKLVGKGSDALNKLCNLNGKTSCDEVLNSKGSTIFGIKIVEIILVYFTTTLITLFIGLFSVEPYGIFSLLSILGVIPAIFSLYTLFLQIFVIKRLCILCLGISISIYLDLIPLLSFYQYLSMPDIIDGIILLFSGGLTAVVWFNSRQGIGQREKIFHLQDKIEKIYSEPYYVEHILNNGREVKGSQMKGDLILGNPDASNTILMISSTFCVYCAERYHQITSLMYHLKDDIQIRIRLIPSTLIQVDEELNHLSDVFNNGTQKEKQHIRENLGNTENDWKRRLLERNNEITLKNMVTKTIVNMVLNEGKNFEAHIALSDWYTKGRVKEEDIKEWISKYPISGSVKYDDEQIMIENLEWLKNNDITATPTMIINDRIFENYEMDYGDIIYYLRTLNF